MRAYWRYEETYRKVNGAWKIRALRLRPRRIDPPPREPLADSIVDGRRGPGELKGTSSVRFRVMSQLDARAAGQKLGLTHAQVRCF